MAEATFRQEGRLLDYTPAAAVTGGEVLQLPDGRAGVAPRDIATGVLGAIETGGIHRVAKTASINILDGGRVYWDHSANTATFRSVNDRDFFIGVAVGDSLAAATYVDVNLNVQQRVTIDALNGPSLSVAVGTQALGGFLPPQLHGGSRALSLTATSEAQKIDILSVDAVAVASNPIFEGQFRFATNGSGSASDFSFGLANATSATDADAITESIFIHTDGGSLNLYAESDDGTTEVAATDTTVDFTAGAAVTDRVEVWIDCRDPADCQIYINGVLMLTATLFVLTAAAGPLKALAHLEKTTGTETAGPVYIDRMVVRTQQ